MPSHRSTKRTPWRLVMALVATVAVAFTAVACAGLPPTVRG